MIKRGLKISVLNFFLIVVIMLFLMNTISSLGIRPAKIEINFQPGFERSFTYTVLTQNPKMEFELYTKGDLSEYVKLDKKKITGAGTFNAVLKLPDYIEKPGKHRILVGVKELFDEELVGTGIGTSVAIQSVIDVYVPYPGEYLEVSLKSHNVNIGEPVDFELGIISRGKEDVNVTPRIEINSDNRLVKTLYFKNRKIKSQEKIKLHKELDTTDYNPGKYNAVAVVDYGKIAKAESKFNIGDLVIYMINHTNQMIIGGIQKFRIEIESGWNNNIGGIHASVSVMNGSTFLINFETSSTSLTPWGRKNITGFFDTSNFTKGFYDANITFFYYGGDVGKSSSESVKIEFIDKPKQFRMLIIAGVMGILVLIVIVVFFWKKYFRKKKR